MNLHGLAIEVAVSRQRAAKLVMRQARGDAEKPDLAQSAAAANAGCGTGRGLIGGVDAGRGS
jgi:hypothetical protein